MVLDNIFIKLEDMDKKLVFINEFKKALDCVICKFPANRPVVLGCFRQKIGCQTCVSRWVGNCTRPCCPLCSMTTHLGQRIELKGLGEITAFFRVADDRESSLDTSEKPISVGDDSDFEDLPPPSFNRPPSQ